MLALALASSTVGMVMCCCLPNKAGLVLIPGITSAILLAIAVVSYGAAISGSYPKTSDALLDVMVGSAQH